MKNDPTYDKTVIEANPEWHLAWVLSEIRNDNAPIGWSKFIYDARCLIDAGYTLPDESKDFLAGWECAMSYIEHIVQDEKLGQTPQEMADEYKRELRAQK